MNHKETLAQLLHHDAEARRIATALFESNDDEALATALAEATTTASTSDGPEKAEQLETLAALWGQLGGQSAVTTLLELMTHHDERARFAAVSALAEIAASDFELVSRKLLEMIEGDDDRPAQCAEELAFLVAELDSHEPIRLVTAMLDHNDPDVVVAALEIAGEWGWDEQVSQRLGRLTGDKREVTIEDDTGAQETVSIGELATEIDETLRKLRQAHDQ